MKGKQLERVFTVLVERGAALAGTVGWPAAGKAVRLIDATADEPADQPMSCSVGAASSGRWSTAGCLPMRLIITVAAGTSHTIEAG